MNTWLVDTGKRLMKVLNLLKANQEISALSEELVKLREELTTVSSERDQLRAETIKQAEAISAMDNTIKTLEQKVGELQAELQKTRESVDAEAAAKARDLVAAQGVPEPEQVRIEIATDHLAALSAIESPMERTKYFRAHRREILAQMRQREATTTNQ